MALGASGEAAQDDGTGRAGAERRGEHLGSH